MGKKYGPNNEYSLIHAIYTFENKSYIKAVYVDGHWEIIPAHMVGWVLDRVGVTKQARLEILSHISKFKRSYSENPKALQDQIQTVLKTLENQAISDKELSFMFDHFSNQADFFTFQA
ncbi:MAG: hypothetical protein HWD59_05675 [Coxiellaceae bacterium]|nr:MAG: hypothetical protein HWD59_05675 [Coxiellaceae bacterium]